MIRSILLLCLFGACAAHQLHITNRCSHTVWVGILGNSIPDGGGYELRAGASRTTNVPNNWSGRVWGRTGCHGSRCETGDCGGGRIQCNGAGGEPPVTLAEITFGYRDFYDVSLVDGYNLQMSMRPRSGYKSGSGHNYCSRAGCNTDLNRNCPSELAIHGTGGVVACKSACLAFNLDEYCCRGEHRLPQTCPPFHYSQIFKAACPEAYSYAYDDQASTFTCSGTSSDSTSYDIVFCG
ncbi:uncharacterized protein LOC123545507 [Mercenaria mercenaria]|uniref:uncharacterized protein LOC123545507 n=1 Tax=Mercenaria mercenaria TaxID=6596 RepID=UPI001E1D809B|nr:uncharacterized protein LOC123545507 [Mercenaria mercenaria]